MEEDFLHYIWRYKKITNQNVYTTQNQWLQIISVGQYNANSGPDFFNAKLHIGEQLWAGNVEVHVKSSDWFVHNHETDANYDNVILHVVWEHDVDVYRKDNSVIPTLELKHIISKQALTQYKKLFQQKHKWINCETEFNTVSDFVISNWLERLYFERLEVKSEHVFKMLKNETNHWEAVFFKLLTKNFGLKVNADAFFSLANSFDFSIFRKEQAHILRLEALLFGQSGLLETDTEVPYFNDLKLEYHFLKQKYNLTTQACIPVQFFRLRPASFPTLRLSQLANLYAKTPHMFNAVISTNTLEGFYNLFSITASKFWDTHYNFNTQSKVLKKKLSKGFIDLVIINTIIPIKFCYAKHQGKDVNALLLNLIKTISSEKNSSITAFNALKKISYSAMESQALIQLKNKYCNTNKCLHCAIGNAVLNRL